MSQSTTPNSHFDEAYKAIQHYARFFFTSPSFYSLKEQYDVEDMVQAIVVRFLTNGYIDRFDPEKANLGTYIGGAVRNFFVDTVKAQKRAFSLDAENDEGLALCDVLPDTDPETIIDVCSLDQLLANLPDASRSVAKIVSPLGTFPLSLRSLAIHLHHGYTQSEISSYCVNTKTGNTVSVCRISQIVGELREHIEDLFGIEPSYSF